ncbi:MAG: FtsX-like permease family protein [Bryobacterales bacterium]|nr:FtsX-like permease family protein [Bryobacterales bacterium]
MLALNRKLYRDLWKIKGQALAISMVIGVGVLMFIMYLSAFDSLQITRSEYYERQRFGHVFASLKRAPLALRNQIAAIPGVSQAEPRVVVDVQMQVAGVSEPATARLVSVPMDRRPSVNDIALVKGRFIEAGRANEVIASENFVEANELEIGDSVRVVLNGRLRDLEIVGVGLSPEYIYTIRPGELIPDDRRFGVFWMERRALAAAFDMEGGFNDVSLLLMPQTRPEEVIATLDALLEPYGGWGAIPRALQLSHWSVENELQGIQVAGFAIPAVFLAVAVFLLHVVLHRIVAVQREQVATLKALGYPNRTIAAHYTWWGLAISVAGTILGTVLGAALGRSLMAIYNQYYRFPSLEYHLDARVVAGAVLIGVAAAILGANSAVRQAVRLQPAEAMRPLPPAKYRPSLAERLGLQALLSQAARIILRNIERQPGRSMITVGGIACSLGILILGIFMIDSIDLMLDVQFAKAQRHDVQLTFAEPVSPGGIHELQRMPGVILAEPVRSVPARLRSAHRERQLAITGLPAASHLYRVIDVRTMESVHLPENGLVLTSGLAEILDVQAGDTVSVEVLVGNRPVRQVAVRGVVQQFMGLAAYMEINALRRLLREGPTLSAGYLTVDTAQLAALLRKVKLTPAVAGTGLKAAVLESFNETFGQNLGTMIFFNVLFASIIAFGVVYNAARVSLAERSRELASLRVMGFTRREISAILLGELGVLALLALPLGLLAGYGLSSLVVKALQTELYALPFTANPQTYAWCALTILGATAISGLIVRRKLDHLDLLEVLKAKE